MRWRLAHFKSPDLEYWIPSELSVEEQERLRAEKEKCKWLSKATPEQLMKIGERATAAGGTGKLIEETFTKEQVFEIFKELRVPEIC